jgi:ketosteroid isomerase-like protein
VAWRAAVESRDVEGWVALFADDADWVEEAGGRDRDPHQRPEHAADTSHTLPPERASGGTRVQPRQTT